MPKNGDLRTYKGKQQVYVEDAKKWFNMEDSGIKLGVGKTLSHPATGNDVKIPKTVKHTSIYDPISMQLGTLLCEKDKFIKSDSGKLKWSLLPFEELKDVVRVLMKGAEKYSADNWKKCNDVTRYKDALMRHVIAYVSGEKEDYEFGFSHLAHAVCNCLFLMWFDHHKKEEK